MSYSDDFLQSLNARIDVPEVSPSEQKQSVEKAANNLVFKPVAKKTITDLRKDPEFNRRATRFMKGVNSNDNIFEYLRDSDFSVGSAIVRSFQVGDWTQEQKDDYVYLREQFDNAKLDGVRERLGFTKDLAVDIVSDPLNFVFILGSMLTSGTAGLAGTGVMAASKAVLQQAGKQAVKKRIPQSPKFLTDKTIYVSPTKPSVAITPKTSPSGRLNPISGQYELPFPIAKSRALVKAPGTGFTLVSPSSTALTVAPSRSLVPYQPAIDVLKKDISKKKLFNLDGKTLKKVLRTSGLGTIEGGIWGGSHEYFNQSLNVGIDLQDEVDWGQVAAVTGIGAGIGGTLGLGASAYFMRKNLFSNEDAIIKAADNIEDIDGYIAAMNNEPKKTKSTKRTVVDSWVGVLNRNLFQKTTAAGGKLARNLEKNEGLREVLELFSYDALDSFLKKNVDKLRGTTYGEELVRLTSEFKYNLDTSLKEIAKSGRLNIFADLSTSTQQEIIYVLQTGKRSYKKEIVENGKVTRVEQRFISDKNFQAAENIRETVLRPLFKVGKEFGVFESEREVLNYFPRMFNKSKIEKNRDAFEKILIDAGHADPIDEAQAFKNGNLFEKYKAKDFIDENGNKIKGIDASEIVDDFNVFRRNFLTEAQDELKLKDKNGVVINVNQMDDLQFLTAKQRKELLDKARKLKASKIVDDMIDYQADSFNTIGGKTGEFSFMQSRRFSNVDDSLLAEFLEQDIEQVLTNYITSSSKVIARAKFGMKDMAQFNEKYLSDKGKLIQELKEQGFDETQITAIKTYLREIYTGTTGVGPRLEPKIKGEGRLKKGANRFFQYGSEFFRVAQQMAHLPLVVASSLTEPMILLARTGFSKGGLRSVQAIYDMADAMFRINAQEAFKLGNVFSRTVLGKKTKINNVKQLDREDWKEAYQVGLAMEQAVIERLEGLSGEAMNSLFAKRISHGFFKTVFLEQWTKAVQLASFTTGKRLIRDNIQKLDNHFSGKKVLSKREVKHLSEELMELNIGVDEGIKWYRNSIDPNTGKFSQSLAQKQDWYAEKYITGADRFTNEVILQPTNARANKPLLFSSPAGKILFQFLGYPTVFSNTVLKRFAHQIHRNGGVAAPKTIATFASMAGVAHYMNILRTKGEILNETPEEQAIRAVGRFGGTGALEYGFRYRDAIRYGDNMITAAPKAVGGPGVQDIIDLIQRKKGLREIASDNAPFVGIYDLLFGPGTRTDIRERARLNDQEALEEFKKIIRVAEEKKRKDFTKGGFVEGPKVRNTKEDPAEAINPRTGLTYEGKTPVEQQMDDILEERTGFSKGTNADSINLKFLQNYHNKNFTNLDEGKTVSMLLGTYGIDDKTYILPTYEKGSGEIDDPVEKFIQDIRDGKIIGYETKDKAEKQLSILRNTILNKERTGFDN